MNKDERIKELEDENAKLKDELQTTKEHLKICRCKENLTSK